MTHTRVGNMAGLVSASAVESVLDDVNFGNAIDGSGSGREGGLFEKLLGKEVASRRAAKEAEEKKSDDLLLPVSSPNNFFPVFLFLLCSCLSSSA